MQTMATSIANRTTKRMAEGVSVSQLYEKLERFPLDVPRPPGGAGVYPHFRTEATQDLTKAIADFAIYGEWSRQEYRWVQITNIEPKREWKPKSREYAVGKITRKEDLVPVRLYDSDDAHEHTIVDGIHRILALKQMGYTHVLAEILDVEVKQKPLLPREAASHYEELQRMALPLCAASRLFNHLNVRNVYLLETSKRDVIYFSILRRDRNVENVRHFPPDCTVVVRDVIVSRDGEDGEEDIHVTATIFSQEFKYHGTYKEVTMHILKECYAHLDQIHI